ncbi:spore cortex biosynthesis protein YabQ [Tannerella forsythia]|uniref:Uncharacterized protein n=1 Tax=Tannerella forsythia TaxID=28112 RepID=A0A3P1XTC4_TANFO|nr:spore cortex biosynthesis protein YabQ [Tannerella forsythia]RRD62082.1 hypothetical protein EII40_04855 [Tannerella forsythia]
MEEIVLPYDVIRVFEDRYEFKRIKRKPILKSWRDCFFSSWAFLWIPVFALLLYWLSPMNIGGLLGVLFVVCLFGFGICYERHRDVIVSRDRVTKSYLDPERRVLTIEYTDNKRSRVKLCDLPSDPTDKGRVVRELEEHKIWMPEMKSNRCEIRNL